jgi:hypothetical protein
MPPVLTFSEMCCTRFRMSDSPLSWAGFPTKIPTTKGTAEAVPVLIVPCHLECKPE